MQMKYILESKKGITLVALVITIVVLLILAGVSLRVAIGDDGIIEKAQDLKNTTAEQIDKTQEVINSVWNN